MMSSFSLPDGPIRLFSRYIYRKGGNGLFIFNLNREEGTFNLVSESDAGPNPSYLCISKKNGIIYASNEVRKFNGIKGGGVTALQI